jgi:two-component system sensor histidine kinase/response regulator
MLGPVFSIGGQETDMTQLESHHEDQRVGSTQFDRSIHLALWLSAAVVLAYVISLVIRSTGSSSALVDGWGVAAFELSMGALCLARYFEPTWQSNSSVAKSFPLVLGAACIAWALGDLVLTIESIGGVTPPVPSVNDVFYILFFPLTYASLMMLSRRGRSGSLVTTALDGLVVGLGVASISAAYFFSDIAKAAGGSQLSAAVNMVYPTGDLLLLALALGAMAVLPKEYRKFLGTFCLAMVFNAVGDMFNLVQPDSKIGHVANGAAWPIALLMLAVACWIQPAQVPKMAVEKTTGFMLPALAALAGMFILVSATIGNVGKAGVGLATATLLVAGIRLTLTSREGQALKSARFRSLIDNARDIIVVTEADFEVVYITPSSERVLGYVPTSFLGLQLTDFVHPDDTETVTAALRHLAVGSGETAAFEVRMRHQHGSWRTISWTGNNLLADPSVGGYVLNGSDVTEVRQATEDLADARDHALTASKAKSQFLSTMSHEIRTPMNGVIGLTELLLATDLDRDQEELASGVRVSAENLLVIINDILDFSKIEAGKLELDETVICVRTVVDDVGRILAGAAQGKDIELLIDVAPDMPTALVGDGVRIQQVLLNLGSNAVKFTAAGDVVIRVSVLNENSERVALRFEVVDMGIGIAEEDKERLFRPFAQADSSTTRRFGGTGLGLTISRQLVDLMGGNLGLVSAPDEGSTFWFELSLGRTEALPPAVTFGDPVSLAGKHALIVDDNATNRKILRQQFHSWGVEVDEAVDGFQALQLVADAAARGWPYNLGVIDLNMPGMDGIELAQILKADPTCPPIALYLLSSSGQRMAPAETHLRGFEASLTKPVRSSELFDCLITGGTGGREGELSKVGAQKAPEAETVMKGTILLVEDNTMNQLVGSKVLTKLGYRFEIANNGIEAVRAVEARHFEAILMDCQMPEMDGYDATRAIRRLEGTSRNTPIIAMTAGAMVGDREACLDAGMDGYITKPVRMETVGAVLDEWIMRPTAQVSELSAEPTPTTTLPDPIDSSQIELLRSLDDGAGAVFGEIVEQYLAQTAEGRVDLLRIAIEGDARALEQTAHTIKGASANVGAHALAAVCAELEMRARSEELENTASLVEQFDREFNRARDALTLLSARA